MAQQVRIDKRSVIAAHELFRGFSPGEIDNLVSYTRGTKYRTNEVIFTKGSPGQGLMAVLSGVVRISSPSPEGRQVVFNLIYPGEIFGEIALLDGKERTADATAITECELLVLERRDFLPCLTRHPEMCLHVINVLCERLRRTSQQVEDLLFMSMHSRLAKILLHLAQTHGTRCDRGIKLDLQLSQRDLASMIGASRESVNRQLATWQDEGHVAIDGGTITITRPELPAG